MTYPPQRDDLPSPGTAGPVDLTRSVVQVLGAGGEPVGTGFLVGERLVVTCAHLLSGDGADQPENVTVRFAHPDNAERAAQVDPELWRSPADRDIAFVRLVDPPPAQAQPLPLSTATGTGQHPVQTFGFPTNGLSGGHHGFGTVGGRVRSESGGPLLQLTGCTEGTEGFSGGPVLDLRTGLVIGMVDSVLAPDRLGRGAQTVFATVTETLREVCPALTFSEVCPYRGLEAFTAGDVDVFHGRGRVVDAVLAGLRRDRRFLALLGPSGSGKSSLVHAGVLPTLTDGGVPGSDQWGWISTPMTANPYAQLEQAGLTGAQDGLAAAARRWLDEAPRCERLVLVLDQAEELLVSTPRSGLLEELVALPDHEPVTVLIVLRDDFYGRLAAAAPALMRLVEQSLVNVPAVLQADELTAIITEPATVAGLSFETGLIERIVDDATHAAPATDTPGGGAAVTVLPLLEFALTGLWHRRADGRLTHGAYEQIGGVIGGLAGWCDQAYRALVPNQQLIARRVLTSLVRPGSEAANMPPTRQRRSADQLRAAVGTQQAAEFDTVVNALAGARLLVTGFDPVSGAPVAELVHDALIREWGLLAQWLAEDHDFLVWRGRLEADHARWAATTGRRSPHDPDQLLRGSALDAATRWSDRWSELPERLVHFIQLSERTQRQLRTRDRRRVRYLAALLVAAVGLGVVAAVQADIAAEQADLAQQRAQVATSQRLAAQAQELADRQPGLAQLLSLESLRTAPTREAWNSIQTTLSRPLHPSWELTDDAVNDVAFSPDGTLLATDSGDDTVQLWDAATRRPAGATLAGHTDAVTDVAFGPDGELLATTSEDGSIRLWDVATRQPARAPLTSPTGSAVNHVTFSPDGAMLATTADGTVRLWDVASGRPLGEPLTTDSGKDDAVFSPNGRLLAAVSDGSVQLWDVATRRPVGDPFGFAISDPEAVLNGANIVDGAPVSGVAFSPDGTLLATASVDGSFQLWDVATRQPVGEPLSQTGTGWDVAFSPDGTQLATVSLDHNVRLWDVASRQPIDGPLDHSGIVRSVAFNPDGTQLATTTHEGRVRLWETATRRPVGGSSTDQSGLTVDGVAFSPDGSLLAIFMSDDASIRLLDVTTGQPVGDPLTGDAGGSGRIAFGPDGKLLVSAIFLGGVQFWDVDSGQALGNLVTDEGDLVVDVIVDVAFSPDGSLLVTAGLLDGVRLWDVQSGRPVGEPLAGTDESGAVLSVAFSPDGTLLVTANNEENEAQLWDVQSRRLAGDPLTVEDGLVARGPVAGVVFSPDGELLATAGDLVRLWDVHSRQQVGDPIGNDANPIVSDGVAFSPDGTLLAITNSDNTVRLWSVDSRKPVTEPFVGHTNRLYDMAFSPDGTLLVTVDQDDTARLWATPSTWVGHSCDIVGRNLSQEEWDRYIGSDTPYVRHCSQYPSGPDANPDAPAADYPDRPRFAE